LRIQDFENGGGQTYFRVRQEADIFRGEAGEGADFEGSYYQSRSDCTGPQTVMGRVREGSPIPLGGPRVIPQINFHELELLVKY
jgi:hypothetical protein